jgi:hypothetical protein
MKLPAFNANWRLAADLANLHSITDRPSPSLLPSVTDRAICSVASWLEARPAVGQDSRPLRKSHSKACPRTWVVLRVHQASTPLQVLHNTLAGISLGRR